jgi:hypothetical protein
VPAVKGAVRRPSLPRGATLEPPKLAGYLARIRRSFRTSGARSRRLSVQLGPAAAIRAAVGLGIQAPAGHGRSHRPRSGRPAWPSARSARTASTGGGDRGGARAGRRSGSKAIAAAALTVPARSEHAAGARRRGRPNRGASTSWPSTPAASTIPVPIISPSYSVCSESVATGNEPSGTAAADSVRSRRTDGGAVAGAVGPNWTPRRAASATAALASAAVHAAALGAEVAAALEPRPRSDLRLVRPPITMSVPVITFDRFGDHVPPFLAIATPRFRDHDRA